ncbi:glycerol-3-phosphate 1-O-acyltransferase PlsY [Thiohalocapsa sp. ML1]|uniref:glycerol-3-phosphate 1-O-acyltransferase PlsY n=1 Tax=Thiohalocapsa sp. ML1 TaxID=1431688 RepID=UPI000731FDE7|nr:glycerol-3-phosphate 1-O-acyltransferase PlsY [Thiohalocapsa sp. ML1]
MDLSLIIALLLVLGAYLLGSVSSAIIVCRAMGLPDPRTQGSNNPGATNVLRIGGAKAKPAAAITLAGDMLKGVLPMLIAHVLGVAPLTLALVGIAAFAGHLLPVFFGFRGGKGVATALGVQLGLYWPIGAATAAVWLFAAKVLKISSVSALLSMALAPVFVWLLWPNPALIGMQLVITGLLFLRHRSNIKKLLRGEEDRIGGGAAEATVVQGQGPRAEG